MDRILYRNLTICVDGLTDNGGDSLGVHKGLHFCRTIYFAQQGLNFRCRIMKIAGRGLFLLNNSSGVVCGSRSMLSQGLSN
ncbi:hypothetical protein BCAR13_440173 [Paraburkholderia caribensis]|nr:hypothetical protein BCAR13_440173 [Paraburkholderia caribensis]